MPTPTPADFGQLYHGVLYGLMSWAQLDALWRAIDPAARWYLYAIGHGVPKAPASEDEVRAFMRGIDALLKREHEHEYCGIVYADDLQHPRLVKIYDPHQLGVSCGSSGAPVLPGWVMSQEPPEELRPVAPVPNNRKRWWAALWPSLA